MSIINLAPIQEWYRLTLEEQRLSRCTNIQTDDTVSLQLKIDNVKSLAAKAIQYCEAVDFGQIYRTFNINDLQFIAEALHSSECLKEIITYHALPKDIETQIFKIIPSLRYLKSLFIKHAKSNQFLCEYNFLKYHPSIESLKVHFQYDMTDELSLQIQDMLRSNRCLRTVELIGWNLFNDKHLTDILDSLQQNSTLLELRLNSIDCSIGDKEFHDFGNSFHSTLGVNPNLIVHMNTKNKYQIFTHIQDSKMNQAANNLLQFRGALMLLKSIIIDDIFEYLLSMLTLDFELDQRVLMDILVDRDSIGKIHNTFKFNSNELIRTCHQWKLQK
ncbi:hypothetical protein BC833DRAFT_599638 [Globomyces pollinis-pini]|nr:hypothetical protein BC833DRAFT_599638 [Globomyces pollinis-pini]